MKKCPWLWGPRDDGWFLTLGWGSSCGKTGAGVGCSRASCEGKLLVLNGQSGFFKGFIESRMLDKMHYYGAAKPHQPSAVRFKHQNNLEGVNHDKLFHNLSFRVCFAICFCWEGAGSGG